MSKKDQVLSKALKMKPIERVEIIDQLIQSLDKPDKEIDKLWKKEAEEHIDAYEAGDIQTK
jgi:hypothetical protein